MPFNASASCASIFGIHEEELFSFLALVDLQSCLLELILCYIFVVTILSHCFFTVLKHIQRPVYFPSNTPF